MKAPLTWLNQYANISDIDPKKFADELTMSGSKVESVDHAGAGISNVVVGQLISITAHPDADRLSICQVDVGEAAPIQIVTAAKNMKEGDFVPTALHNSHLPTGMEIKKTKMRGVESFGMFCSHVELGLTLFDVPYGDENGLLILPEGFAPGTDIRDVFEMNDFVVDFEITSNRPDCLSMVGLAREAAATFDRAFTMPDMAIGAIDTSDSIENYLSVAVDAPTLCPRYLARMVKNVKIAPSPDWMRNALRKAGIRPINNIVDITNYVMLEFGQPLHAFDYRHLRGKQIIVRTAASGECITTLDDIERKLDKDMLLICDEQGPTAVAGVMGGEFSGIADDTATVVFESAHFFGPSIRQTSRKLGLRTEASGRFEKGLDPEISPLAAARACHLVEMLGCGTVIDGIIDVDHSEKAQRKIPLRPEMINKLLGTSLTKEQMTAILTKLDFTVDANGDVLVPSFRADVEREADLSEEVARIFGYNNIPTTPFSGEVTQGRYNEVQMAEKTIHNVLWAQGLSEIITYSFISPKYYDNILLPENSPLRNCVVIKNPLGEDTSVLRTTLLPSFLDILSRNYNYRNASAGLYEIGRTYLPSADPKKLPEEKKVVVFGFYNAGDYYHLKGVLDQLLSTLGVTGYKTVAETQNPSFHPGRCANVSIGNGEHLAILGQVHPGACEKYDIAAPAYVAMVDEDTLLRHMKQKKTYQPLPKFPALTRDLALLCDDGAIAGDIEACIRQNGGKHLERVELFDVFRGAQIAEGKKSMAYSLTLRDTQNTLTDEAADKAISKILKALEENLGVVLRS